MVYGIMLHSVENSQQLHFSHFFTPEGNDENKKVRQQTIMRKILEDHLFHKQSVQEMWAAGKEEEWGTHVPKKPLKVIQDPYHSVDYSEGVSQINEETSEYFSASKLLVWKQIEGCVYTLICSPIDSPIFGLNFLTVLIHELFLHFKPLCIADGATLVQKYRERPDDISLVLEVLLPGGQLICMTSQLRDFFHRKIHYNLQQKV
eukprot:Filipodium_phascolosomae@DN223_c0_g1_i1.p1